jgi:Protein of unknown function, DUF600
MKIADINLQNKILNDILFLISDDIEQNYENFEFHGVVDDESTECTLFIYSNGQKSNPALSGLATVNVSDACMELNKMMEAQQGKPWTSFTMTYQNGGKAEVKYNYDPLPDA